MTATRFGIDKQIAEQNDFDRLPFRSVESEEECRELRDLLRILEREAEPDLTLLDAAIFEFYSVETWQREYIADTLRYDLDFVRHGSDSQGVMPPNDEELRTYAGTIVKHLRGTLANGELTINADIISGLTDLACVVIRFDESRNRGVKCSPVPRDDFSARLAGLLHAPLTSTVQLRRSLVHFDEDRCIIVKLAQKRFWSRARSYDDADTILEELCRGGE